MTFIAKSIAKAELYNENFNHYFTEKLNSLTPEQKLKLPIELSHKIFKRGTEASAQLLNLNEKMWILEVVFNHNVVITVSDENGLDIKDYTASLKAQRGSMVNGELLEKLKIKSAFALGGRELMASLLYVEHVSCSSIYQLVKKSVPNAAHPKNQKFMDERQAFIKTLAFLKNYEANKRRISMDYGLTMPEWYALVYFSINEAFAIDFYNKDFKFSYNSNRMNLHKGMKRIFILGYLDKRKVGAKDKYTVSAKGMDLLGRIFNNILLKV